MGLSSASIPVGTSKPSIPVAASFPVASTSRSAAPPIPSSSSAPPILAEDSDSEDQNVQTVAVPFRSGNSDTYLPMVSLDDAWHSDAEFRFVCFPFYLILFSSLTELRSIPRRSLIYERFHS